MSESMQRRQFLKKAIAGGVTAGIASSAFINPIHFDVNRFEVALPRFPASLKRLRIVQMSDLHRNHYTSEEFIRHAAVLCNEQAPDIVVLTGDFIGSGLDYMNPKKSALSCFRALADLKASLGIFAVSGNHDYWHGIGPVLAELSKSGIRVLTNKSVNIKENIFLIGVDDFVAGNPDVSRAFQAVPPDAVKIVITHSPAIFPELSGHEVLVMAGHTHGGHIHIPIVTSAFLSRLPGWRYVSGWYKKDHARMYVNRGIGRGSVPRFRCRPEITVFDCIA